MVVTKTLSSGKSLTGRKKVGGHLFEFEWEGEGRWGGRLFEVER